ncbi:hypothetical protein AAFP35_05820 [Gordonia sp. CPCC 206044]|uniref:hypothetical protein n=1 Tax=Gordonia sp. CPCC 206044 TaxID=3140793 RepID=UPI003AF3A645
MLELLDDIRDRAESAPHLVAVRLGEESVTYGALHDGITSYAAVMDRHGMSAHAALYATLLNCMPSIARIGAAAEQNRVVGEVVAWLARHLPGDQGRGHLRAVS